MSERAAALDDLHAQIAWRVARAKASAGLGAGKRAVAVARDAVDLAATTDSTFLMAGALEALAAAHAAGRGDQRGGGRGERGDRALRGEGERGRCGAGQGARGGTYSVDAGVTQPRVDRAGPAGRAARPRGSSTPRTRQPRGRRGRGRGARRRVRRARARPAPRCASRCRRRRSARGQVPPRADVGAARGTSSPRSSASRTPPGRRRGLRRGSPRPRRPGASRRRSPPHARGGSPRATGARRPPGGHRRRRTRGVPRGRASGSPRPCARTRPGGKRLPHRARRATAPAGSARERRVGDRVGNEVEHVLGGRDRPARLQRDAREADPGADDDERTPAGSIRRIDDADRARATRACHLRDVRLDLLQRVRVQELCRLRAEVARHPGSGASRVSGICTRGRCSPCARCGNSAGSCLPGARGRSAAAAFRSPRSV